MVNLEEIKGEKKHYKTPVMEVEFLTWADIVTTSPPEGQMNDNVTGNDTNPTEDPFNWG